MDLVESDSVLELMICTTPLADLGHVHVSAHTAF